MDEHHELALPEWHERDTLPPEVIDVLRALPGDLLAIVATVDPDGAPRTAAFGVMRALSPTRLRFGCRPTHRTFTNIATDGRVMVALYAPDVAVGIRGRARVLADELAAMPSNALIEIDVEVVKNDHVPQLPLTSGVTYARSAALSAQLAAVGDELETWG